MLTTYLLALEGREIWTASLDAPGSEKAALVAACGARYVTTPLWVTAQVLPALARKPFPLSVTG